MKISELSQRTGVSIPTLKFYLREGLLPQGQLSSPNQAEYDEAHVRRAALIRTLRDVAGLSIAKIRSIVDALEHGEDTFEIMGHTVNSLGGEMLAEFTPAQQEAAKDVDRLLTQLNLEPAGDDALARHQIIAALAAIRETFAPGMPVEGLLPYAEAAMQVVEMERQATLGMYELQPEQALEQAVLGLALFEPMFAAFRRLAHGKDAELARDRALAAEASPRG